MTDFDFNTATFKLNPLFQFQWEEAQQCYVLLYPEGLVKMSDSAAEILQRCQQNTTLNGLVSELNQAFPDAEDLAEDVKEFLKDAQQQTWIVAAND